LIVVDTNVLVYLYLPTEHTEKAEALLRQIGIGLRRCCGAASYAAFLRATCGERR